MIRIFGQTDKAFLSNGDVVLQAVKAKITKKDNGDYYLSLETGLEYVDYIVEGNIVVANTPQGDQAFRIDNVTKTKSKITTKAWHVSYDAKNYLIADSYVVDKTCNEALNHLNNATEPLSEFTVSSDITDVHSYRCVRKSLYEALQDIISRWGGHLVRNNFSISIKESIGVDNGVTVQYKKNLKEITCEENWNNVCTKLLPVGADGVLLNAVDPSASIYVTSPTQYALPYTKSVTFSQDINKEDFEDETAYLTALVADLRQQADAYLEVNSLPQVNYTLKANLDKITDIGDTVEVNDERLGILVTTHVIGFEYDCILDKYTQVEFGNFAPSLSNLVGTITQTASDVAYASAKNAQDDILSILSDSYVIYDGAKILIVDSLPKESAQDVITIDHTGIGFSQSGVAGQQTSKWSIGGDLSCLSAQIQSLSVNGNAVSDVIKSKGTTNGWTWRKYASGQVEAWLMGSISASEFTWSSWQNLYQGLKDLSLPFNIYNAVVIASVNDSGDVGWMANARVSNNNTCNLQIVRENNTGAVILSVLVRGTESS